MRTQRASTKRILEHDGGRYDHPRQPTQTVLAYADALNQRSLTDPELPRVARILGAEFYGPTSDPQDRAVAESILERAVVAAALERKQRRRARRRAQLARLDPRRWRNRTRRSVPR